MWQALHEELSPAGLDIVTVALDTDIEAARPFHERAQPTHPSLIDQALVMVELFGITNVPFGLWIDETGTIVRPPEVAFTPRDETGEQKRLAAMARMAPEQRRIVAAMMTNVTATERYTMAVRDWVANGPLSPFVLSPEEVVSRSRPRPAEFALAAAHFELAQHLHRTGFPLEAVPHFTEAHRLDPENWSYQREALSLVEPSWGQVYEQDLITDVAAVGAATFYPRLQM